MAALSVTAAMFGLGVVLWPLVEYGIHGGLAHGWRTPVSPLHWDHHLEPRRVFTSPIAWLPAIVIVFLLLRWLLDVWLAGALVGGLLCGFFRYEYRHWRIHFRAPRTERERRRRAHHLAHHDRNPRAYYGVSTPFWDQVFGTLAEDVVRDYAAVADQAPLSGASNLGRLPRFLRRSRLS